MPEVQAQSDAESPKPKAEELFEEGEAQPASELIEKLGFGWSQTKSLLIGGGIWLADGAELLLISGVSRAVGQEWGLTPLQRGAVVSVVFFGILLGNLASGPIGDNYGRKNLLVTAFLGIFVFSVLSACAWGYFSLCIFRLCVGIFMGSGQPAWGSLGAEISPSWMRAIMMSVSMSYFTLGECFSASMVIIDDPSMVHLHWRCLLLLGSLPAIVLFFLSAVFLRESPIYLAHAGLHEEAREVLEAMRDDNGAVDVRIRFSVKAKNHEGIPIWKVIRDQMGIVFGSDMLLTTVVVMLSCFTLNMGYYGCLYAFPQLLPDVLHGSAGMELLIGAFWEIPGNIVGAILGFLIPRKQAMKIYLGLSACAMAAFSYGAGIEDKTRFTEGLMFFGYYGIKGFVCMGFVIVYQYAVEVYPTEVRITGSALNLGAGRLAATIGSILYEEVVAAYNFQVFFYGVACLCLVNFCMVDLLSIETFGVALKDSVSKPADHETAIDSEARATAKYGSVDEANGACGAKLG